jgi:hydrogenase maturation protease
VLTIIGCGNPNRSDDGAGIAVVQELVRRKVNVLPEDVEIYDSGTDGMGVMFKARGATSLIVVDACRTGAEPGAVFEVPGSELEGVPPDSFNLHDFRWDHALYTGRQIFKEAFPKDVRVFLIEAASIGYGLELSDPVRRSVAIVADKIAAEIDRHAMTTATKDG